MTQAEFDALRRKIKEAFRQDLQSLQRIWELSKGLPQSPPPPATPSPPSDSAASTGSDSSDAVPVLSVQPKMNGKKPKLDVLGMVREVVRTHLNGDFTSTDVAEKLLEIHPHLEDEETKLKRASVTSALSRLVDQELLELIEVGAGKRPSLFRKSLAF